MFEYDNLIDLDKKRSIRNFKKSKHKKAAVTSICTKSRRFPSECLFIPIVIVCFVATLSIFFTIAR
ncbi:hypothetical protein SAMN02745945_02308 [Peptoclostridium litorale DSM 5388]|uniref:Uncharacterized protein n=1 Tax=Peptoclostridium litorale DSM 5388 TaxID=1121324 RepID=A0A069RCB2_PEPLI|nr:hypothetical protein CLIT_20c00680 [Peptoclostridium litorale DSM 5388]SIO24144.1 hypothetical protein SAMN02745945_02308 [Peptoclostridium litorale DSM 5388]